MLVSSPLHATNKKRSPRLERPRPRHALRYPAFAVASLALLAVALPSDAQTPPAGRALPAPRGERPIINPAAAEILALDQDRNRQMTVPAQINGSGPCHFIFDTGAQASLANNALRERIRTKRAEEVTTTDVNRGDLVGQISLMRRLTIEGLSLTNVPLTLADTPAFAALGLHDTPAISLGMQHLALFDREAIDFANRRVLFGVPREVARQMRKQRSRGLRAPLH
jgi:hypothetical protein